MRRNMFSEFAGDLKLLGVEGACNPVFNLGHEGKYDLAYIPFEYVNTKAKLVIVGITPGNTQVELAYQSAQALLNSGAPTDQILVEVKKAGAFGGPSMKPNLLKILRHFRFEKILGIQDVDTLWGDDADLLNSTSVVPHAAFKDGERFNGSFDEIMRVQIFRNCFMDCFVSSVREMNKEALFVALGPCPQAALDWCVKEGVLQVEQVLGSFCHPSSAGGSTTRYYLREVARENLDPKNPVLSRCDWLDQAYKQMFAATTSILSGIPIKPEEISITGPETITTIETTRMPINSSVTKTPIKPKETPNKSDITVTVLEIERHGYLLTNTTSKLLEFRAPNNQIIYLDKGTSKLNDIQIIANPSIDPSKFRGIQGIESISENHYFNSNMRQFPKRLNKGKTETAFGWKLRINSQGNLARFLSEFGIIKL